jgi:hypothetical protein
VIGVADALKGQSPLGFLCLNKGCDRPHAEIVKECVALMREPFKIGPVADFKRAVRGGPPAQDALGQDPARHHGQDRRRQPFKVPATIDDPAILDEIRKMAELTFFAIPSSLVRIMPPRGPRSVLCVVVVATCAWGNGLG